MEESNPYPLDVLLYNLEDRRVFLNGHDEEMDYICSRLSHYYEDVKHAIDYDLSHSVVSHYTYNLVLVLAKGLTSLTIYEYMRGAYLLEEGYDNVYKTWKSVHDSADEIISLLTDLEDECYFDEDIDVEDFLEDILPPHCKKYKGFEKLLNYHRRISLKTGSTLVNTLICYLRHMERWLSDFKNGMYKNIGEDYDKIYLANYKLYKQEYWPKDGQNFRSHLEDKKYTTEDITPTYLSKCLWNEKINYEQTPTGQLWRDYFNNKKDLYFEAKRINLDEKQWRYFFKSICRFEEYKKWINELQNPGESDQIKQKRDRLLKSNKVFNLQPTNSKKRVDILLIYQYIEKRFLPIRFVYEWYALYYRFKHEGILYKCTMEEFVNQMNNDEWFPNINKKCSANEINTYSFLDEKAPDNWHEKYKPVGNRATKKSVNNIYDKHSALEDTIEEIYISE